MSVAIRDIEQLKNSPPYAVTAVEGLLHIETELQEAIRFVPYCDAHKPVWSAPFARIVLEAASQVDSIWKAAAGTGAKLEIKDHYQKFGALVAKQQVVFFGSAPPSLIAPFRVWQKSTFESPEWWQAYNKLKHDRLSNQTRATLDNAVQSVAALFLAILYSGECDFPLLSVLETSYGNNPWANTNSGLLRDVKFKCRAKLETKLFAHPLSVFGNDKCNLSNDWGSKSIRFNAWWAIDADKFAKPLPPP